MSFARFVWMLKQKALWMSRIDQLDDAWEGLLGAGPVRIDQRIFINCWTAQDSESHAMWSLYCRSKDGVAVQTTPKLKKSVPGMRVLPVKYVDSSVFDPFEIMPLALAVRKRKPFQYEKEQRIVHIPSVPPGPSFSKASDDLDSDDTALIMTKVYGFPLSWDPEEWLEAVLIHPGADYIFGETVRAVVEVLAPDLQGRIRMSRIATLPPTSGGARA
jgi:hypothetical protein